MTLFGGALEWSFVIIRNCAPHSVSGQSIVQVAFPPPPLSLSLACLLSLFTFSAYNNSIICYSIRVAQEFPRICARLCPLFSFTLSLA